jgi:transcriptional regulator GlxA family with amidase domain
LAEIVMTLSLLSHRQSGKHRYMDVDPARQVTVVVFDGCALLDVAGPTEVFRMASLLGAQPGYRIVVVSPDGGIVRCDSGITLVADMAVADASREGRTDTLLVAGGFGVERFTEDPKMLDELRRISAQARRTTSVCTGALALARAGLLDGYRATTHWAQCDMLQLNHPAVTVEADRIYVHDDDRWTSAGVTAGIDLALALVDDDHGVELAHSVAGALVVFARRPGGQAQFSVQLQAHPAHTPALAELQRWLPDHLSEDLGVESLARRTEMSPRSFARIFRREIGTTPAVFIEQLRVEAAKRLLASSDLTIRAVALRVGFGSSEILHRAFTRRVGTTPSSYRDHFARRGA